MPPVSSKAASDDDAGKLPLGGSPAVPPSAAGGGAADAGSDAETQMDAIINNKGVSIPVNVDPLATSGGANKAAADADAVPTRGPLPEPAGVSASDASGGALMSDSAAAKTDASAVPAALARAQTLPHKRVVVANKAGKRLPTLPAIASSGNLY